MCAAIYVILYHGEDKDIIFLGSSKTYSTICPETVQENLGMSAFDLASSGQGMMGGYYLLEEYFKYHRANYVVLEMQENKLLGFGLDEKGIHAANYQITDALKKTIEYFGNISMRHIPLIIILVHSFRYLTIEAILRSHLQKIDCCRGNFFRF